MHKFSPLLRLAPQLFYQLYTIHGYLCGRLLPLVYCSISGKSEDMVKYLMLSFNICLNVRNRGGKLALVFKKY